jgi:predicted transcriptional regulator
VPYLPENSSENTRAVLGKDVMDMVWSDMKRTQLPTWVGSVPSNWGTPKRGKLTANHWRVVCTIHLPITLIRLWDGDTGRRQDLLKHFMDLVTAVRIANMRISTASQVEAYNTHMLRYVSGLQTLYPDQSILPSHHGALHIGDMLQLFGPVHSHSAPFFERYINFFHHMNTNLKFGKNLDIQHYFREL